MRDPCPIESACPVTPGCHICGWTKAERKAEDGRRKAFARRAREIIAAWPDYAKALPEPANETDRAMQVELKTSQCVLIGCWAACREGNADAEQFTAALTRWWVDRLHAIELGMSRGFSTNQDGEENKYHGK